MNVRLRGWGCPRSENILDRMYTVKVRRIPAVSLLLAVSFALIAPVVSAAAGQSESDLPSCCRRDGKHHCSMADASDREPGTPALNRAPAKCGQYPRGKAVPIVPQTGLAAVADVFAGVAGPSGLVTFLRRVSHSSLSSFESCFERGPPSFVG
jgi:hypothetical protein